MATSSIRGKVTGEAPLFLGNLDLDYF